MITEEAGHLTRPFFGNDLTAGWTPQEIISRGRGGAAKKTKKRKKGRD
jgi:hypothetical protein